MSNSFFQFKQFIIHQDRCAMKVTTDACLFGAWVAREMQNCRMENVVDVGTGTGLLSLMIAQKNDCIINALEINENAAQQAKQNVSASLWKERISVTTIDVLKWKPDKKIDVIVCNPPFYENELKSGSVAKDIAHHDEGLKLAKLFAFIKKNLANDGSFYLVLPSKRATEALKLVSENDLWVSKKLIVKQTTNHDPFRIMLCGNTSEQNTIEADLLSIKNEEGQYTKEFIALLKEYYLYL